jgi:hypothetical protein
MLEKQSMIQLGVAFLAFVSLQCLLPQASAACTNDTVAKCFTVPVNSFEMIFNFSDEQFETVCKKIDKVPHCLRKEGCTMKDQYGKSAYGLAFGFKYLCEDAKSVLAKSQQCMASAQSQMEQCKDTYWNTITRLFSNGTTNGTNNDTTNANNGTQKVCAAINDLLKCLNKGVVDFCDTDMEKVFKTYLKKIFPDGDIYPGCSFDVFNNTGPPANPRAKRSADLVTSVTEPSAETSALPSAESMDDSTGEPTDDSTGEPMDDTTGEFLGMNDFSDEPSGTGEPAMELTTFSS